MRLGVLSDIHANLPALEAALEALRREEVDEVLVLGDVLAYGPHPRQVVRTLRKEGLLPILGAWDLRVLFPQFPVPEGVGKETLEFTRRQLQEEDLRFLQSLRTGHRRTQEGLRLVAFHGLPGTPDAMPDWEEKTLLDLLQAYRAQILLLGGSHLPLALTLRPGLAADPGSVGLSLGGVHGADVLILDLPGRKHRFLKIPYDLGPLLFDLKAWGLPPILEEIYRTGRLPAP
ncbi:MAG: metallophosphoesterase family protein [Thermaceae bacterium]